MEYETHAHFFPFFGLHDYMNTAEKVFNEAYTAAVNGAPHMAIKHCREALRLDPHNFKFKVYLGILLDDHGTPSESEEAKTLFINAIQGSPLSNFATGWGEEAALLHLGILEEKRGNLQVASLYYLLHAAIVTVVEKKHSIPWELSINHLKAITPQNDPSILSLIQDVLGKLHKEAP